MLWATKDPNKGLEELNSLWGLFLEGETLAFHLSKWRSDPRHPISNVAKLKASSWKWTRTSAELRAPHVAGKDRQEQEKENMNISWQAV